MFSNLSFYSSGFSILTNGKYARFLKRIFVLIIFISANLYAQARDGKITITKKNVPLVEVFQMIEEQTDYLFFYEKSLLQKTPPIDISVRNATIDKVMKLCLKDKGLIYSIVRNMVVINSRTEKKYGSYFMNNFGEANTAPTAHHANYSTSLAINSINHDRINLIRNQMEVRGTVTDEERNPLVNASVIVKGSSRGTNTDASGNFSISVTDANAFLIFSFTGFAAKEVKVTPGLNMDVVLFKEENPLTEVVVTALGIKRQAMSLGYSTTTVNTEELVANRTTNVGESLEGRVAGLNITPPAAGAGASNQIRLRGQVGFAGADNSPLIVVDGLPLDQGARNAEGRGQQRDRGDNLANINPDDIESMTVLKGATAAALYGSRAARGAIIITTKSGQRDQGLGVEFTSNYTISQPLNFFGEIEQTEYGQGQSGKKFETAGQVQGNGQFGFGAKIDDQPTINYDGETRPYSAHPGQLFQFLQNGKNFVNTIAVSGGDQKGSFRASMSTTDADGIVPNNVYKRKIFNIGVVRDISSKLHMQVNINYANENYINPPQIGSQGDGPVNFFNRMPMSVPIEAYREHATNADGAEWKTNGFLGTINNPFYPLQNGQHYQEDRNRLLGTSTLRFNFTDWLFIQGRFNYDYGTNFAEWNELNGTGAEVLTNSDGTYRGTYHLVNTTTTQINADFLVGANREFGKLSVDLSAGGNTFRTKFQELSANSSNFSSPDLYSLANGNVKTQTYGFNRTRVNSLYALAELGFDKFLYLNLTGRNDWFSVLNPAINHKFYPSVSGSFIFSNFLQDLSWLSFGKLRGSWAKVGSIAGVGPYEGRLVYNYNANLFNGQTLASVGSGDAPNQLLEPFSVEEKEIGLEFGLFQNRLRFDIAGFDKHTTKQIVSVSISDASGYSNSKQNLASLKNKGYEILVEYDAIRSGNFSWVTSWNHAALSTKVLDVGNPTGTILLLYFNGTGNEFLGEIRYTNGLAMNQLYTRTYRRNAEGQIMVSDDGRVLASEGGPVGTGFYPVGSSIPKYTGGWNNSFNYKNLRVGVFIDYKFGGTVLSSTLLNMTRAGLSKLSLEGREDGLLVPGVYASSGLPNKSTIYVENNGLQTYWTDYRNLQIGDPFTFKSDFIKLRSISVGYNLTELITKSSDLKFVKGIGLTASVRNVLIIYKDLPGLDPEAIQSSGDLRAGYENSSLPTARSYNISLNVKF